MRSYVARRVLQGLLVLWLVSFAVFSLVRILPGDAVLMQLDQAAAPTPEILARARQELGLDPPIGERRADEARQPHVAPGCDVDGDRAAHRAADRRALRGAAGHDRRLRG